MKKMKGRITATPSSYIVHPTSYISLFLEKFLESFHAAVHSQECGCEDEELGDGDEDALVNLALRWEQHRPHGDDARHYQSYCG